ncbi:hypothetical protein B296_00004776 [Ensete ventricosum]|uniref:Uncharacterized protein n=1 Tax=Ensete ventricosum TaxID=4639 RepID=A0A427BBF5_ENSVE|nr:hypothetical protein B296_00004776 [Ensete ventricosum]
MVQTKMCKVIRVGLSRKSDERTQPIHGKPHYYGSSLTQRRGIFGIQDIPSRDYGGAEALQASHRASTAVRFVEPNGYVQLVGSAFLPPPLPTLMKSSGLCPALAHVLFFDMDPAAARRHGFAGRTPPCSPVRPPPPLMSSERFLSGYGQEEPCVFRDPAEKRAQDHGDPEGSAGSLIGAIGITPNAGILLNASSFYGDLVSDRCKNEVVKREERRGEKQVRSSSWSPISADATAADVVKGQWTAEEDR